MRGSNLLHYTISPSHTLRNVPLHDRAFSCNDRYFVVTIGDLVVDLPRILSIRNSLIRLGLRLFVQTKLINHVLAKFWK